MWRLLSSLILLLALSFGMPAQALELEPSISVAELRKLLIKEGFKPPRYIAPGYWNQTYRIPKYFDTCGIIIRVDDTYAAYLEIQEIMRKYEGNLKKEIVVDPNDPYDGTWVVQAHFFKKIVRKLKRGIGEPLPCRKLERNGGNDYPNTKELSRKKKGLEQELLLYGETIRTTSGIQSLLSEQLKNLDKIISQDKVARSKALISVRLVEK